MDERIRRHRLRHRLSEKLSSHEGQRASSERPRRKLLVHDVVVNQRYNRKCSSAVLLRGAVDLALTVIGSRNCTVYLVSLGVGMCVRGLLPLSCFPGY